MADGTQIQARRIERLLREVLPPRLYPKTAPLEVEAHFVLGEPIDAIEAYERKFHPFQLGQPWGGAWSTAWFRLTGTVPEEWAGAEVVARIDLGYNGQVGFGGEGLLWDGQRPLQGINPRHNEAKVACPARGGETVRLHLEAAANPYVPWGGMAWPLLLPDYGGTPLYTLDRAELAVIDRELGAAWTDLRLLYELADALGHDDHKSVEILRTLDKVALAIDLSDPRSSLLSQRHIWEPLLANPTAPRSHLVTAVGHAHIDSAWLWPIRETRRKCARTFSSAIRLMEEEPDFVFVCSQAQQHAWMKDHYPALFAEMKEKAAAGQLEPVGSMWVEPDTNLPSGESLIRQLVFGKRFFIENYGIETDDCWLPDAFGYSANLPQILRAAGVRFFLTQKLSWNEIDHFPHHSFWWEGIDGSRVLAHCPPTDTYNGDFTVAQLLAGQRGFAQHGISNRSLYAFGYGDGGGGPTRAMLDSYRRLRDLDPLPRVELGTAGGFFRAVEAKAVEADAELASSRPGTVATAHAPGPGGLPVWVGELYLERHRAVQTTQAQVKLGNRRCEALLREAEMWAVAGLREDYPHSELDHAWRLVLLHQFHDMLPGSSIHWVHEESRAAYVAVAAMALDVIERACANVAAGVDAGAGGTGVVVFNAASHDRRDLVVLDRAVLAATDLETRDLVCMKSHGSDPLGPVQELADGSFGVVASVPGCGWAGYALVPAGDHGHARRYETGYDEASILAEQDGFVLSNGVITARVGLDGTLSSLLDRRTGRQLIAEGATGNVFQLHYDLPNDTDAWDVDQGSFARASELRDAESAEIVESGPVRAALRVVHRFGSSLLTQEIRLVAGSQRLEFATEVEWAERHRFLKVAFPLAVRAPAASFEVQFGYVARPTHANTSWDAARFEVPAQRWADLSEPGCGMALINDCKYGYDVRGSVMRLSLLRGPTWPDPEADQGTHRFSYAVMPHLGLTSSLLQAGSVTDEAEAFNLPLRAVPVTQHPTPHGSPSEGRLLEVRGAMVSALKLADDGGGVVVRVFEPAGAHAQLSLRTGSALTPCSAAALTDALERPSAAVEVSPDGTVERDLRPFELLTVVLRGAAPHPEPS